MEFITFFGWIFLSIGVGVWASSLNKNGFGWGGLSLLVSPLIAGIILLIVSSQDNISEGEKAKQNKIDADYKAKRDQQKAIERAAIAEQATIKTADFVSKIEKNFSLFENNLLDQSEYDEEKRAAISQLHSKRPREPVEDFFAALIPLIKKNALNQDDTRTIKEAVRTLAKTVDENQASSQTEPDHGQANNESELMKKFDISFDGVYYYFQTYRYTKCSDAISYARLQYGDA
jgi:hypothetical protein